MTQDEAGRDTAYEQATPPEAEWLVMIYLAGDNNLSPSSIAVMQELIAANPPHEDVRVLACFDPNTPRPRGARYVEINRPRQTAEPDPTPCWYLHNDLVPFDDVPGHAVSAPDFCNPDQSTVRPNTEPVAKEGLSRFLEFALRNHRAKKHMLILFGHGTAVAGNTFLADDNPPSFLRLRDFAEVMARHFDDRPETPKPKLDLLACDNCMMNGVEIAYQLRRQVSYILGSQGLMLTVGWPFRKIIKAIVRHQLDNPRRMAQRMLRVCARNLVDFSLMDRSSEQAVCDLTTLRHNRNVVSAVKRLVAAMNEGLEFDECGEVIYPAIRDAIRLARLEAQGFWAETFVDLYDFCELLLRHCNQAMSQQVEFLIRLFDLGKDTTLIQHLAGLEDRDARKITAAQIKDALLRRDPGLKLFGEIAERCWQVLEEIGVENRDRSEEGRGRRFVRRGYYVGSELQYSHGVSIYFPWTLPQDPIIFEPMGGGSYGGGGGGSGGSYGVSWVNFDRVGREPADFILKTAFDEYKEYDFAKCGGGDWAAFLEKFFRATLRDVRRFDFRYKPSTDRKSAEFFDRAPIEDAIPPLVPTGTINLQKSGSDNAVEEDCTCPTIKNYPRRFYISPADCQRRCTLPGAAEPDPAPEREKKCDPYDVDKEYCVSYLGWNPTGLVASVIGLKQESSPPDEDDDELELAADEICEPREERPNRL